MPARIKTFVAQCAAASRVLVACALVTGCASDDGDGGPAGSVDTSNTQYCSDYVAMCPSDGLRKAKEEACLEECTSGVKPGHPAVRDSVCWKLACSLELGMCQSYDDSIEPEDDPYLNAINDCAMRRGWYSEE